MGKSTSKVLNGGTPTQAQTWRPPEMSTLPDGVQDMGNGGGLLTADKLQKLQEQAYKEGFEKGRKEGFEFGHKEGLVAGRESLEEKGAQLDKLLASLETPFQQLDDQVESELVELVISMVRQLVRREVRNDPGQIIGVVREAMSILPVSSRSISLILHPEDASLVRETYELSDSELGWRIIEDPVLARGGCRISTETSQVDATLESRLATLIAPLLGGERDLDGEES